MSASFLLPKRTCLPMVVTALLRICKVVCGLGLVYNSKHLSQAQTLDLGTMDDVVE